MGVSGRRPGHNAADNQCRVAAHDDRRALHLLLGLGPGIPLSSPLSRSALVLVLGRFVHRGRYSGEIHHGALCADGRSFSARDTGAAPSTSPARFLDHAPDWRSWRNTHTRLERSERLDDATAHSRAHVGLQGENAARFAGWDRSFMLARRPPCSWSTGSSSGLGVAVHNPWREKRPEHRFLWFMSVPMFLFFLLFSLKNGGGEPNWPITAYLSGMVLAGPWVLDKLSSAHTLLRRSTRVMVPTMAVLGVILTVLVHEPRWVLPVFVQLARAPSRDNSAPRVNLIPLADCAATRPWAWNWTGYVPACARRDRAHHDRFRLEPARGN